MMVVEDYRVRYFRGRVSNSNQSEARKRCFLASDWLKFEILPKNTVLYKDSIFVKCNVNLGKILTNNIAECLANKLSISKTILIVIELLGNLYWEIKTLEQRNKFISCHQIIWLINIRI